MEEHPEVVTIYAKFCTNLVFITFLKKNGPQEASVAFLEAVENAPHKPAVVV